MDRFLTWPLVAVVVWGCYILHIVSTTAAGSVYRQLALFVLIAVIPSALGVWYGISIKNKEKTNERT